MMEVGGADTCIYGGNKRTQCFRIIDQFFSKKKQGRKNLMIMNKFLFRCQFLVLLYERQLINTHTVIYSNSPSGANLTG